MFANTRNFCIQVDAIDLGPTAAAPLAAALAAAQVVAAEPERWPEPGRELELEQGPGPCLPCLRSRAAGGCRRCRCLWSSAGWGRARARELLWRWRAECRSGAARRDGPGMSPPLRGRSGGTGCAAARGGTSAPACARSTALPAGAAAAYLLLADAGVERELCVLLRPGGRGEGERAVRLRRPGRGRGGRRPLARARAGRSATDIAVPPGGAAGDGGGRCDGLSAPALT